MQTEKTKLSPTLTSAFLAMLAKTARFGGIDPENVHLAHESTENLVSALKDKVSLKKLFAGPIRRRGIVGGSAYTGRARLEENYLYSTRRFPALANNTIGGGTIAVNRYSFFSQPIGGDGSTMGFPTGFVLAEPETNMEGTAGTIAQGQNFVFNQIGISFNSDAATADIVQVMDMGGLVFQKAGGQFQLTHGPAKLWPGGTGASGYAATAVGGSPLTIQAAHNGVSDVRAVRSLKIPRVLREKETFTYLYVVPRATKSTDGTNIALSNFVTMTIWLWGGTQISIPA